MCCIDKPTREPVLPKMLAVQQPSGQRRWLIKNYKLACYNFGYAEELYKIWTASNVFTRQSLNANVPVPAHIASFYANPRTQALEGEKVTQQTKVNQIRPQLLVLIGEDAVKAIENEKINQGRLDAKDDNPPGSI